MPRVRRTAQSRLDYLAIWTHVATDNISAADRLILAFDAALEMLANRPRLGRRQDRLTKGLRSWTVKRYLLFYLIAEDGIELVRVLRGARNLRNAIRRSD